MSEPTGPAPGEASEQEVGKYELVARLAVGGMGELFLARERGIAGFERLVVIKRILPNLANRSTFREMFLREARILARVNHPNVVQTIELGEDQGNYYLVMEYIRGSTLRELQLLADERDAAIPVEVALGIVVQGLRGLHAAHDVTDLQGNTLGLVHRDISPHNLMCTPNGNVKLFDFGVAKATEQGELTYSGQLKGKFTYMSPEQCKRLPLDRRSDVFSMGIVLWEMLARERLFKRDAEVDTMNAIIEGVIPDLRDRRPGLPAELHDAVDRALAVDREERWSTGRAFERRLTEVASEFELDISPPRIAEFVRETAGERLADRADTLAAALERALTKSERLGLIHATGSYTANDVDDGEIEATIQVKPISLRESEPETPVGPKEGDEGAISGGHGRAKGAIAAVVLSIAGLGVAAWLASNRVSGPPLRIQWAPSVEPDVLRAELEPIRTYLEDELRRPVELEIAGSYRAAADSIVDGTADLATLPPYTYVKTKEREPSVEPLVSKIFDGSKSSDGLILVPSESAAKKLADLEGKKFCFSDENSTTGYVLPRAHISEQGFDPDEFVGAVHFSGNHISVLEDLLAGRCQAGATYSGNLLTASSKGIATGNLRRLALTGSVPHGTLTASPDLDEPTRKAVVEALLAFDPQACCDVEYIGDTQRITGFSPQYDDGYEQLRRGLEE